MNVLIVDDEPLARQRIRRMVDAMDGINAIGEAGNGREALEKIETLQPDIVTLDIRMPEIDGMETARHLSEFENPPAIIFTTAYGDYALQAFDALAVDYLVKPIREERLKNSLGKATKVNRAQLLAMGEELPGGNCRTHICARMRGGVQLISIDDIYYFKADQKYVTVFHKGGEVLIEESLVQLEQEFADKFLRIHRNALISQRYLVGVERDPDSSGYRAVMSSSEDRPEISRRHAQIVKQMIHKMAS